MGNTKIKLPTISVVTPTYDGSLSILERCLTLIRQQSYPQANIEIILGHGGSEKIIKPIAKKFNASYCLIPLSKQNAEYNRGVAFQKAKHELVLILDHDNFMTTNNYLRELVQPFLENADLVATESCYFHYEKSFSALDRYYALIGTLDPIPYYLGKADRLMQTSKKWNLLGESIDKGSYFLVRFQNNPRKIPTVGTNGCLMNRKIVVNNANTKPEFHFPIDVMVDVVKSGHTKFAFVKNSLIHLTGSSGVIEFLKRRLRFVQKYHFEDASRRRYSVYMPGDHWQLLKYIIYSITFIKPIYDSIRGYLLIKDLAWFIHPIMCFGICIIYGYGTVRNKLKI